MSKLKQLKSIDKRPGQKKSNCENYEKKTWVNFEEKKQLVKIDYIKKLFKK